MFDGVHAGHRHLLDTLIRTAREQGRGAAVVTFDRHPLSLIAPERAPLLLTDPEQRRSLLLEAGVDRVEILAFDETLRSLTARRFTEQYLINQLSTRTLLLGYDHGFGSDRIHGLEAMQSALTGLDIDIRMADELSGLRASSSLIRHALREGRVEDAAAMLGRPYSIHGTVEHGRAVGRTIGFPTANILPADNILVPAAGVYCGYLNGMPAIINVGTAPTVNGTASTRLIIEAHILNQNPDLYGKTVSLAFTHRLRDEITFPNLDALKAQLQRDRLQATSLLNH